MVEASGTGVSRTMTYGYDFHTGQVTSSTDVDNGVSTLTTLDDVGRPILVKEASGKSEERRTQSWHCDEKRRMIVRSDLSGIAGSGQLVTATDYDGRGRVRLVRSYEGDAPPLPTGSNRNAHCSSYDSETAGIKVAAHYLRSGTSSTTTTSNPYRGTTKSEWTRTKLDNLGRVFEVGHFSGTAKPSAGAAPTLGKTATAYDGEYTTVTDPAGKTRRSCLDGLGRLVRVDEPTGSPPALGTVGSPNQGTSYSYNALDNLTRVTQGAQTRTFAYDSLSRLTSAANPESGTIAYTYDNNGNLTQRTDARGVVTAYTYDRLDRLTRLSYSYTGSDTAVSLETTRVDYAYDRAGNLTSQTYPSGRDPDYFGIFMDLISVTVVDNDPAAPGVMISPSQLTVREGEAGSYAVVLVTRPTADVTIAVAVPEEASVRVEPTSLTFTSRNWSTPQTVTVTALEDDDEVSENHTLTHTAASTDSDYNGVSVDGVALTVVDNDTGAPGVMISPSQLTVREGEAGRYAVVLTARPTHAVTVVMEPPSDGKLSVSPESLAFSTTDWSTAQTVRVTAHEDGDKADGTMSLGHRVESADGNYQGVAAGSVQVGVTDDDDLEVRVSPTRLTIAEGGEGSYTLVMVEEPPRGLTVTIGNPDGSKLRISPESVEFTSGENGNWNQPQTVTVTALQDADAVSEKLRITHEAAFVAGTVTAKEYIYIGSRLLAIEPGGGVAPQLSFDDVRVEITDDEASAAGLTVSPGRPAIAEGYTGSYTVAPNSRPTHPGTLTLEVSPASLSFSRSNRHRPRGVSLPAAADGGSAAHFGATRDTVNFGAQSAAIESWGAGTIVALAPLHLPEGGARVRANSRAGNGVTATGNPFHRERDEVECEALENCPEDEEEDSPPDP